MYQELVQKVNSLNHTEELANLSKKAMVEERYKLQEIIEWCKVQRILIVKAKNSKYPKKAKTK